MPPEPSILYPPVEPYAKCTGGRYNSIVMLGRFFQGRQSKGHDVGIGIFRQIYDRLPAGSSLTLIGNLMPGHDEWLDHLKQLAEGLPVEFLVSASADQVRQRLCHAKVQWHLTGLDVDEDTDPASIEHFGLAVGEGMTAGIVPVVLSKGGVTEIVEHGVSGYRSNSKEEIGTYTLRVMNSPEAEVRQMRAAAIKAAERFNGAAFRKHFATLVHRGFITKSFKHLVQQSSWLYRRQNLVAAVRTNKVAVLIEPRIHWALDFVVANAVQHLGPEWMVHVFHGQSNGEYARSALSHIANVKFTEMPLVSMTIPAYNKMLTSLDFWKSVNAEHVLTIQTDSVLLGYNIDEFLQYDFMGAPWHVHNERWGQMRGILPIGVGNGGVSLRRASAMRAAIKKWGHTTNSTEQEDIFFSRILQKEGYRVASREVAYEFCIEVLCEDIRPLNASSPPFALHASWYYISHLPDVLHPLLTRALN